MFEVVTDEAVRELEALSRGFNSLSTGFKKLSSLGNSFSKTMHTGASSIKKLTTAASALSGVALGKVFADATKEAIDYYETLNLFQVAMKGSIEQGNEFINTISEWYGLDPKNLMQYTGTFYEMAYAVEAPDKAAQQLATSLTALSVDLASLFNVDVEKVTNNLTSGIRGMSRAVVKYGLDLRATTVEAYANSLGITQQYESMNEASREILRYLVAVKQARDATGDFGRTIEQPANQLRVFKEQMSQVGRAVGTFIIQPLQAALPVINGFIMAIRVMLETLATIMGFKLEVDNNNNNNLRDTSDAVASIGSSADDTKKKIKSLLAPFDELNVLQEDASSGSSGSGGATLEYGEVDPVLLQALEDAQYTLEEVRMKAMDTRDAVLAFFGFKPDGDSWVYSPELFEKNLKEKFPNWQKTIEALFNFDYKEFLSNVSLLFGSFKRIAQEAISIVIQDLSNLLGIDFSDSTIAGWIDSLNQKFFELRSWIVENEDEIAQFLAKIIEFGGAFLIVSSVLGAISKIFSVFSGIATTISGIFGVMSGAISAVAPAVSSVIGILGNLVEFLTLNLTGYGLAALALFVAGFIDGFKDMWSNSEQFRDNIGTLVKNIGDLLLSIVDLVKNLVKRVIDVVRPAIQTIGDILQPIYPLIVGIINSIVGVVRGLVDILNGILTGDLTIVFKGFMKIIMGLVEAVINVGAGIVNSVISLIFGAINGIGRMIYGFIKGVVKSVNAITGLLGLKTFSYPSESLFVHKNIPQIVPPAFDYKFAEGGVVTGPTRALIGEAGRSEAVIPLDNSPQMKQLVNQIAEAVKSNKDSKPIEVRVFLDSREITSAQNRANRMFGKTQMSI